MVEQYEQPSSIRFTTTLDGIDWAALKKALRADRFDNGRTAEQLHRSFEQSAHCCFAWYGDQIVGTSRVLSDGVCNAYLIDLWTQSNFRRQGIATEMVRRLSLHLHGQHIYLQADEDLAPFYRQLGFEEQPAGMSRVVGTWLNR